MYRLLFIVLKFLRAGLDASPRLPSQKIGVDQVLGHLFGLEPIIWRANAIFSCPVQFHANVCHANILASPCFGEANVGKIQTHPKSLVYMSMCLCDGQKAVSLQFSVMAWLCLTLCSVMYQPLSADRSSLINAGHSHLHDLVFSAVGFPCGDCRIDIPWHGNCVCGDSPRSRELSPACTLSSLHSTCSCRI